MTQASATALAGTGLIGVAKDNLPWTGQPAAFAACFIEIELDTETGKIASSTISRVADCGTVIHPMGLATQIKGGAVQGIGLATLERLMFDPQNGLPGNVGLLPGEAAELPRRAARDVHGRGGQAGPVEPGGREGHRRARRWARASALLCAISDALGGHYFNRTPVMPDMIVNALAGRPQSHKPLQVNTA